MLKIFSDIIKIIAVFFVFGAILLPSAFADPALPPVPPLNSDTAQNAITNVTPPVPNSTDAGAAAQNAIPQVQQPVPGQNDAAANNVDRGGVTTNDVANQRPTTNTGSFLSIGLPQNHGLPGSNGANSVLTTVIGNVLSFVALIAIVALVYSGIQLFAAQGKADAIGNAKQNILGVIIGFAIVMLAWSGVNILLRFIGFTS